MPVTARVESDHLIISHKRKCSEILSKTTPLSEEELIDVFISLHIILEVGLNTLLRHLSLAGIKKQISEFEVMKNLDSIEFIEKVTLFIYNSVFDLSGNKLDEATRYHRIIGQLKRFAGVRNKLLHGHSISTIYYGDAAGQHSETRRVITEAGLKEQLKLFIDILEGMRFYVRNLHTSWTHSGKESLIASYLDDSFIPSHRK